MKLTLISIKPNAASSTFKIIRMKFKKTEKLNSNQIHIREFELLANFPHIKYEKNMIFEVCMKNTLILSKPNAASLTFKIIGMKFKVTEILNSNQIHIHELELLANFLHIKYY